MESERVVVIERLSTQARTHKLAKDLSVLPSPGDNFVFLLLLHCFMAFKIFELYLFLCLLDFSGPILFCFLPISLSSILVFIVYSFFLLGL